MSAVAAELDQITAIGWFKACTIGWFVGFLTMIPMLLLGSLLGEPQFTVPVGIGIGVAIWQARYLRGVLEHPIRWVVVSVTGLAVPFVLWDITSALDVNVLFWLPTCAVLGGLLAGIGQAPMLAPRSRRALWWAASTLAWSLPVLCTSLADAEVLGAAGEVFSLAGIFLGGAMIGAVTARPLVALTRT